jgi:hypothetical protein
MQKDPPPVCASRVKEPEIAFDRVIRSKQAHTFFIDQW